MKYKVVTRCFGYQGRLWEVGEIVDVREGDELPPKHFILLEIEKVKPAPHRTEAREVKPGESLDVKGGMGLGLKAQKIDRVMTTDKVPIIKPGEPNPQLKKKDAGSVKRSG